MSKHMQCAAAAVLAAAVFVSGCATALAPAVSPTAEQFSKSMADAEALAARSDTEGAIRAYQKVASDNPSRGEPWARVAQIQFARGQYSLAIVAAEETLKRDPANRQAKSVTAVGGLRLAAKSLEDLRNDSALTGDATADAQRLAVLLRETLGQPVLVPQPSTRPVAVRRPAPRPAAKAESDEPVAPAAAPAPVARAAPAPAPTPAAPAPARPRPSGGNPLDAFK